MTKRERAYRVPRRKRYPHDYGDMSCSYEEAEQIAEIEMRECRCPQGEDGPDPFIVNDLCEWHGGILGRAMESGRFWDPEDSWPWGEWDQMSPQPTGLMIAISKRPPAPNMREMVNVWAASLKERTGIVATVVHCAPGEAFEADLPVVESPKILKNCIWVGVE